MDMNYELTVTNDITILIKTIKEEIEKGKVRIEHTIANEKTTTYWNIGKYIHEHLLNYSDKAEYGDYLFITLSQDLYIGKRTLYMALQFYETYPKIVKALSQLKWAHYLVLITVHDEDKRREYEQKVINENLSTRELKEIIKNNKETNSNDKSPKLKETRGLLHTYKLKTYEDNSESLDIDLGFRTYVDKLENKNTYTKDSIIRVIKNMNSYKIEGVDDISPHTLYTYKGRLKKIIDGDTLWVYLDLGFGITSCRKVRLRGINAAKIETETGQKARKYLEKRLNPCPFIIVKTYYRDKYNRYLADIFYDKNEPDTTIAAETGVYLNQELLDKGFAEKY